MRNHSHQISRKTLKHILFALFFIGSLGTPKASAFFQQEDQEQEIGFDQYKGKIMDSDSKKPLVFATLTVENTNISTISNTEGEFALKVPESMKEGNVIVAFLGYKNKSIPLSQFQEENNKIYLDVFVEMLGEVSLSVPKDAEELVRETLKGR